MCRLSLHVGHALDTYTFYADKPKTFFCDPIEFLSSVFLRIHGVDQLWFFCGSMGVYQFVVFLRTHGSLSALGFLRIHRVYQLGGSLRIHRSLSALGFFADPWESINLGDLCWCVDLWKFASLMQIHAPEITCCCRVRLAWSGPLATS